MSLINEQKRQNAEVEQPEATHIKTADPTSSPAAPQVSGDSLAQDDFDAIQTGEFPDAEVETAEEPPVNPNAGLIDLSPNDLSLPGVGVQAPSDESTIDLAGRSSGVWQDIAKDYGVDKLNAPEVLSTKIPTVYQSLPGEGSYRARQLGEAAIGSYQARIQREQEAEANRREQELSRLNTPNTPQIDKRGSTFGRLFNDFLFGSEQAQQEAHAGRYNPLKLQYGRQGAGVGGWAKYILGMPLNLAAGVAAEGTELLYGGLRKVGVPEETAKKFAQAGVLGWLPKPINPTTYFGFDFKKAASSNQILDALVGESTGDTNDPEGNNKGVFTSRAQRPAPTGNALKDFGNIAASDPVGTAREVIVNIFNPFDKPIDDIVGAGLRYLIPKKAPSFITKKAPDVVGAQVEAASASKTPLGLPPGKATEIPVEEQLRGAFGQQAAEAGARARQPQKALPSTGEITPPQPVTTGGTTLGGGIPVEGTRLVNNQPSLPTSALATTDEAAQEFAVELPPVSMEARLEKIPLNQLPAAQPTKAPRIVNGTNSVTQRALPPAVDLSANGEPLGGYLVRETPAGAAMKIGIGKPSEVGIEIGDDIVEFSVPVSPARAITESKPIDTNVINFGGKQVSVVPHPLAQGKMTLVDIDELASKVDNFVEPSGANAIGNRLEDTKKFLNESSEVYAPEVYVRRDGKYIISDGRHRLAVMKEAGIKKVPVMLMSEADEVSDEVAAKSVDSLLDDATDLAAQKAVIEAPMKQLEEIFDTTVDFGRRVVDEVPYRQLQPEDIMDAFTTNARLNFPADALRVMDAMYPGIKGILRDGDYDALADFVSRNWIDPQKFVNELADVNNEVVNVPTPVNMTVKPPSQMIVSAPPVAYHGTSLSGWTPAYNISLYGTRGELGSGLYLTTKPKQAADYATALVSENISPVVADRSVNPGVFTLQHSFERTLDARAKLPSNSPEVSALLNGLPEDLVKAVKKSLQRDKTTTYNGLLTKIEANLVRSGQSPTEEVLQSTYKQVSDNLRMLGIDSVYDAKSGFLMALDSSKLSRADYKPISAPKTPLQAAVSRYNNDAYAAKFYPERLTSDANLRDSAYKVLSQLDDNVDKKLKAIQTEIINKGLDKRENILPPRQQFSGKPKPEKLDEALADFTPESNNLCD